MQKLITTRTAVIAVFFIVNSYYTNAQENGLYWSFGITNHNYLYEGSFFINEDDPKYFGTVNSAPTLALGYRIPKIKSEIELSYYISYVAAADKANDIVYSKSVFSGDYNVILGKFRTGINYSLINERHSASFAQPPNSNQTTFNIKSGLGIKVGYETNGFAFDIRKDQVVRFYKNVGIDMEPIDEQWNFRITKKMPLKKDNNTPPPKGPFSINLGMMVSGNYLANETASKPAGKVMPSLGIEYLIEPINLSVYAKRSIWLNIEAWDRNFSFTNQLNYLGVSYHLNIKQKHLFKLGVHHLWNLDKSSILMDQIDSVGTTDGKFWVYENKGVGLDLRYAINKNWDASFNLDYYYKANPRIGTGINPESFRLGLIYNLY
ncbi:hypothetical protein Oweho_1063 [Owenweeksia hongkongensis DSM 17368]|uniref:Uncharacterized protein n=1 Tax=Owenweeksia hongkongensis (strain DSM 17368 / CIP 108786 / JCM 12287 / NRRL B-23963 / UST20020801) TaxID=926562 RepID=G8R4I2_OWEHD|nr:hypothetical protein [Owenweeksia hongkongensis]AEV32071.1 hypothetical protein Oweho_1063 [Owenweeksia hongkongensis DSM 17368]